MMILCLILSLIFICLAAISDSIVDACMHHYDKSIFSDKKYDKNWWDSSISWKNKYVEYDKYGTAFPVIWFKIKKGMKIYPIKKPVQLTDAFHFFKMFRIIFDYTGCVLLGISTYMFTMICGHGIILYLFVLLSAGVLRNTTFTLFYHKLLMKKEDI